MPAALVEFETYELDRTSCPARDPRAMSAHTFVHLLARLHPDRDEAAEEYERLRRALMKFFDWRGVSPPDECADEALDRLARKIQETSVQDVRKYVYGIARMVALERRRRPVMASLDDVPQAVMSAPPPADDGHYLQGCFDRCLAEFPEESRKLILDYYEGERADKISNRRRLASALGLSDNALRSRVQRLRDRLEQCVRVCAAQPEANTP